MYDPKIRLVILIYTIVIIWATSSAFYSYFFGDKGLDWITHLRGIVTIGGSVFGGFFFIWLCSQFMTFSKHKKTGFEATFEDETGTGFNFPVSLSKYIPEIVAYPYEKEEISPLEQELIGFLNAYRHWPYDITGKNKETLYEHAMKQWKAIKQIPNSSSLHRAAALAQDLSLTYVYKEKRKTFPYWQFWKRDQVSFSRRCINHCGFSAVFLATFPAFRALGTDKTSGNKIRRALLTAIRYRDNPISIPANCDPLVREIYESLHRAAQLSVQQETNSPDFAPSEADIDELNKSIYMYLQSTLRDLEINPADLTPQHEGAYLGDGKVVISLPRLIKKYRSVISPALRGAFDLWDIDEQKHPSWPYFIESLKKNNVLLTQWEDIEKPEGIFSVNLGKVHFENAIFVHIQAGELPELRQSLDMMPKWNGLISIEYEIEEDEDQSLDKAKAIDKMIDDMLKNPI